MLENSKPPKTGDINFNPSGPLVFFWITFLRVKRNQHDFAYSYLDEQQIGKRGRSSNTSWK